MSQWAETHQPCPKCTSSDGYSIHKDGHGHCFVCNFLYYPKGEQELDETGFTYEYIPRRGISKETHEFFNVKAKISSEGKPIAVGYPYPNGAVKTRRLDKKEFYSAGDMSRASGFAKDRFPAGSAKAITVTEGEDDAMSAYEMLGKYPVYSVRSSSSALSDVRADFEYLNSFEKIYLCLDDDEPGKKATAEIAAVFDFNKVYHVKLSPYKDATDYREADKTQEFRNVWFNAGRFLPEGVVSSFSDIDAILDDADNDPGHPWPFKTLNYLTDGLKRGRAYLLSGLEGIGKTEFFHAVEYHLAKSDPQANIAIIHLEEPTDENIRKLVGYELRTPTTLSDSSVSKEEIKKTYRTIAGREDRIHFYNHYGTDDPDILESKIRFFVAACKCKYVFLDNITIVATGRMQEDERKELDYFSTRLEMLVKSLKFILIAISHENDNGQTRGSRNISKVFDVWINMKRDIASDNEFTKNLQYLTLLKGRGCRGTGPAGRLSYDTQTATLSELSEELPT